MKVKSGQGGATDEINSNGPICVNASIKRDENETADSTNLHQEDSEGEFTIKEYIEVRGTEKAYDSGLCVGSSMRTASMCPLAKCLGKRVIDWDLRPHPL